MNQYTNVVYLPQAGRKLKLNLDLLRVCRLVYEGAALVPFASNTFICKPEDSSDLSVLAAKLTSVQRTAVQSVEVHAESSLTAIPRPIMSVFPNVTSATIFMPGDRLQDPSAREKLLKKFLSLQAWPLTRAGVIIYCIYPDRYGGNMFLSQAAGIAAEVKALLLQV